MRYYDTRAVVVSNMREYLALRVPTYSPEDKSRLAEWNCSRAVQTCAPVGDAALVWILKTPKAASTTLQDLVCGGENTGKPGNGF